MKNQWLILLNFLALAFIAEVACSFQTSLWMQVFGNFPAPMLWMVQLTYSVLHRRIFEGVALVYVTTLVLSAFTVEPFEHLLLINLFCLIFIQIVKNRIYWSSPTYFMLMTGATAFFHVVLLVILSQFLDKSPVRSPEIFQSCLSILLTMLSSLPLYRGFLALDRITERDETAESTGGLV